MGKTSKDKRDIYYRLAKEQGWRARSAFKLLAIDEEFKILQNVQHAVDLCAAPGSWSQVLAKTCGKFIENPTIIAVDNQEISPIAGVISLREDITDSDVHNKILSYFGEKKADIVVCDGAPDVTGMLDWDEFIQKQLVFAGLKLATKLLRNGGIYVSKVYRTKQCMGVFKILKVFFDDVTCAKPRCCRDSSLEAFAVCQGFSLPSKLEQMEDININHIVPEDYGVEPEPTFEFISCGSAEYDADRTYSLGESGGEKYVYIPPVQGPISAPYQDLYDERVKQSSKTKGL